MISVKFLEELSEENKNNSRYEYIDVIKDGSIVYLLDEEENELVRINLDLGSKTYESFEAEDDEYVKAVLSEIKNVLDEDDYDGSYQLTGLDVYNELP